MLLNKGGGPKVPGEKKSFLSRIRNSALVPLFFLFLFRASLKREEVAEKQSTKKTQSQMQITSLSLSLSLSLFLSPLLFLVNKSFSPHAMKERGEGS